MNMSSRNLILSILMIPSPGETQSAGYWLEKGNELCNSGQMEEAIKAYEFALSLDATLIDAWNNKGLILANEDRLAEALQCFDEVLKISPRHAYTLSNKGMVLAQQKKYQDALGCFEAALVVDPYFAGAWYNKALAHAMPWSGPGGHGCNEDRRYAGGKGWRMQAKRLNGQDGPQGALDQIKERQDKGALSPIFSLLKLHLPKGK